MSGMIDDIKDETRALLPDGVGKDLTLVVDGELIFLTGVFDGGHLLGFWSHSSWGTCNDMETGWVVITPDLKIAETCAVKVIGQNTGDYAEWRRDVKDNYGTARKLCDEITGEMHWRLSDT